MAKVGNVQNISRKKGRTISLKAAVHPGCDDKEEDEEHEHALADFSFSPPRTLQGLRFDNTLTYT